MARTMFTFLQQTHSKPRVHRVELWGSDRWWVETHDLVVQELLQLLSADVVLVHWKE